MNDILFNHNPNRTSSIGTFIEMDVAEDGKNDSQVSFWFKNALKRKVTVVVQIGNSDDKLSQRAWSLFIKELIDLIKNMAFETHFSGSSNPIELWQNYCMVAIVYEEHIPFFKSEVSSLGKKYNQESIAFTIGYTEFI